MASEPGLEHALTDLGGMLPSGGKLRPVRGLTLRRQRERADCLKDA